MIIYDPAKHEILALNWWLELTADPVEHAKLFMPRLRTLSALLHWAAHEVKLVIEIDDQGIAMAAWLKEYTETSAEAGAWLRKDCRKTVRALMFMRRFYAAAFTQVKVLIGITKQPELARLHEALGYRFVGEVPYLYDGDMAYIWSLTKERDNGRRQRQNLDFNHQQSLRGAGSGDRATDLADGQAGVPDGSGTDGIGVANGRREQPNPDDKQHRRRRARKREPEQYTA